MTSVPEVSNTGFSYAFAFFFAVVFLRTQATYWLARYVAYVAHTQSEIKIRWLAAVASAIRRAGEGRGTRAVERWGGLAVLASFFASGTKTIVSAGAGLVRMRFAIYLIPMLLGCVAHGIIYATVGWAAWVSAAAAVSGSQWGLAALIVLIALIAALIFFRRRRSLKALSPHPEDD